MLPKSLKNCVAIIKTMRKRNISYQDACRAVAQKEKRCLGTIRDACTRFGKSGKNQLSVYEVERQVRTGEIVSTLKQKFPEHRNYIDCQLGGSPDARD